MKEKTKEFLKKYLIGFILGIVSACTISVIAATYFPSNQTTYDNSNTELKSENVQDAIDELYGVCTSEKVDVGGKDVIVVDEGDGLYKDEYEDGRYFYKGGNPNNYVYFNCIDIDNQSSSTCEIWRIISINADKTIKIMRDESIGNIQWDSSNSNNWARPASLNTYLNSTYYNELNANAKNQIVVKEWGIGAITGGNNDLANQINNENATKWNGKVALATVSEYIRSNSNKSSCGSYSLIFDNYSSCVSTGWMDTTSVSHWWTLSPASGTSNFTFYVNNRGQINYGYAYFTGYAVRPVVYLSSDVKITGGDGSDVSPFELG